MASLADSLTLKPPVMNEEKKLGVQEKAGRVRGEHTSSMMDMLALAGTY